MAKATRWMVRAEFGPHQVGDIITDRKLAEEFSEFVLRLPPEPEDKPVKEASPAAEAREAVNLPAGPTPSGDAAPKRTAHKLND